MRRFTAIFLAVVMLFALSASAFAAANSLETDYAIGDGLGVSVDLDIEGMYFDGEDILNTAENGYYPFSFSLIVSNRTKVASVTVSNGGSFHWAYVQNADGSYATDADGNYVESTTTNYGVVVLPTTSASTVTVVGTDNIGSAVFNCAQPSGGTTAAGAALYAYLPAPAQFVNEGVTTGGWGDAYDSTGSLKANSATGVSLGFFGGYAVYKFDTPIADDSTHPYGADFIVYGNAFWGNSEAGCIQVSKDGQTWYDIAGSMYYTKSTPSSTITYTNPSTSEDAGITTPGATSTLAAVNYTLNGAAGTVTTNTFHNHSWFPLNANYFAASGSRAAMAKVDEFSFVSRTLASNGVTDTLTFTGTLLNNYPGISATASIGFGYCDVHPNRTLGSTVAYNPYQTFTSSSDYNTKTEGTGGGDPIDIAWAVNPDGTPAADLDSISYVRIYTGMAQMNGIFGEISTEVCGIAACDAKTGSGTATSDLQIWGSTQIPTAHKGSQTVGAGTYYIISSEENVYVNGTKVTDSSSYALTVEAGKAYQIITQNGTESPYLTVIKGQ